MGYKKNKKCEDIYLVQSDILRKQTHNSWRAAHVSFSPKLNQWNRRGGGKATIYALVVFSNSENPAPNVFSRGEKRGVGVVEDWRTEQADTKRPYVYVVALWLKIMNTKIICNLSGPQYIRSALLARLPILAAWDTFRFDVQVFRGFSCMKGVGQDPHPHKEALYQPGV